MRCYFSLDRKVTKRSRLHRPGYFGKRLRSTSGTRFAQTAAALSAPSFPFASRPPAEARWKKAPLSLGMADIFIYLTSRPKMPKVSKAPIMPAPITYITSRLHPLVNRLTPSLVNKLTLVNKPIPSLVNRL